MPVLQWSDVQQLPSPPAGRRIAYGNLPEQFGELRLPPGDGPHPVVVLIHGGCWRDTINLDHIGHLAAALTRDGLATWSLEYRRCGHAGGGWPGTFDDVLAGIDHLGKLEVASRLDLTSLALLGHSAGGHLALWAAAHRRKSVCGVVSLSGITDLRGAVASVCSGMIPKLVGSVRNYPVTSPIEMLPLGVAQWIITASLDVDVPASWGASHAAEALKAGDDVHLIEVADAGHFELIVPSTPAYSQVRDAAWSAVRFGQRRE